MGNGASVTIHPPHLTDDYFKSILSNKSARDELFHKLQEYKCDDHLVFKDRLSLKKIVSYFTDEKNKFELNMNVIILTAAFNFSVKKKKHHELLTKKEFHYFIPTLFLFYKLWDIFDTIDNSIIDDDRIFEGEFMKMKEGFNRMIDIEIIGEITNDDWEQEFLKLDKNNDGYITFEEFCKYVVNYICKPYDYVEEFQLYGDIEDDVTTADTDVTIKSIEETVGLDKVGEEVVIENEGDSVKSIAFDTKPDSHPTPIGEDIPIRTGLQIS